MKASHPRASQHLLSIDQIATSANVGSKTVRRLIADGELRTHKIRGQHRISEEDWQAYLARIRQ